MGSNEVAGFGVGLGVVDEAEEMEYKVRVSVEITDKSEKVIKLVLVTFFCLGVGFLISGSGVEKKWRATKKDGFIFEEKGGPMKIL